MRVSLQYTLLYLVLCAVVLAACSECGSGTTGSDAKQPLPDSGSSVGLNLEQISLGSDLAEFRSAAAALANIDLSGSEKPIACQPRIELSVPDVEAEVIQERSAGGHTIESCAVLASSGAGSSPLVRVSGDFLDARLVKVSYHLKPNAFDLIAQQLSNRLGRGRQVSLAEQSVLEGDRSGEYLVWERGRELWLLSRGIGDTAVVSRQDLVACRTLPAPPPPSERGKPVSLEDLGIGKLDLNEEPPDVTFNDAGEIVE